MLRTTFLKGMLGLAVLMGGIGGASAADKCCSASDCKCVAAKCDCCKDKDMKSCCCTADSKCCDGKGCKTK